MDINTIYKIILVIASEASIVGIFYFALYKLLLNKGYHEEIAKRHVLSMTALYTIVWSAFVLLFLFNIVTTTIKFFIIFFAGIWTIHFIFTILFGSKKYAGGR
jgi:hypothetical protein